MPTTKKTQAKYVDGYVLKIPKKHVAAYKKMAREGAEAWMRFGALDYKECMGEELKAKAAPGMPAALSFTKLTGAKPSETVWFSFVTYKSKAHRNQVNKKVMAYMSKKYQGKMEMPMPFDMKDMAVGGFSVEVSA